MTKQSDSVTIA